MTESTRTILNVLGGLLILMGLGVMGYLAWTTLGTDFQADRAQAETVTELQETWESSEVSPVPVPSVPAPEVEVGAVPAVAALSSEGEDDGTLQPGEGNAFAIMEIPRFGEDYQRPIVTGVGEGALREGIGHYPGTAGPGQEGNFSVAGHRTTWGKPFSRIAELETGDQIIVRTADATYTYEVYDDLITTPRDVSVLSSTPGEKILTMTSCHPQFSARERYIVHARLVE